MQGDPLTGYLAPDADEDAARQFVADYCSELLSSVSSAELLFHTDGFAAAALAHRVPEEMVSTETCKSVFTLCDAESRRAHDDVYTRHPCATAAQTLCDVPWCRTSLCFLMHSSCRPFHHQTPCLARQKPKATESRHSVSAGAH